MFFKGTCLNSNKTEPNSVHASIIATVWQADEGQMKLLKQNWSWQSAAKSDRAAEVEMTKHISASKLNHRPTVSRCRHTTGANLPAQPNMMKFILITKFLDQWALKDQTSLFFNFSRVAEMPLSFTNIVKIWPWFIIQQSVLTKLLDWTKGIPCKSTETLKCMYYSSSGVPITYCQLLGYCVKNFTVTGTAATYKVS